MKAFDSRDNPSMIAVNKFLQTYSRSSILLVKIARRTMAPQKEEIFVTDSESVHLKASKLICNAGTAILLWFKRNLKMNPNNNRG